LNSTPFSITPGGPTSGNQHGQNENAHGGTSAASVTPGRVSSAGTGSSTVGMTTGMQVDSTENNAASENTVPMNDDVNDLFGEDDLAAVFFCFFFTK